MNLTNENRLEKPDITMFLDIDGVLATTMQYCTNRKKWHPMYDCYKFDETCVKVFNQLIEKLKPIIVLSSDWKLRYSLIQLNEIFEWNGVIAKISGITPDFWGNLYKSLQELEECRAAEILAYINEHKIEKYVVIDDLDLSPWFPNNFVRTPKSNEGIKQSGIKDKILNKLNFTTK
jgi:hypothetical protein